MKKLSVSAAVALALVLLMITIRIGSALLPRTEANGNFTSTSTTIHSVMEDKFNEVIDLSSTVTYTGTFEGTSILQGTLTVYRDGSGKFQGVETFTGLVNGIPGTLTFKTQGDSNLYQTIQLTNVIRSGTGQLSNLHGEISKTGIVKDNGPVGTYTGQISHQ